MAAQWFGGVVAIFKGRVFRGKPAATRQEAIGEALKMAFGYHDDTHEIARMKELIDKLKEIELRHGKEEEE